MYTIKGDLDLKKNNFKVIRGGASLENASPTYDFVSAYGTNTRLLGVVVVYIHWKETTLPQSDLHQFFYFDVEEFGFDTCKSLFEPTHDMLKDTEDSIIGGLGAKKVPLTEKEAISLVKKFIAHNLVHNISLPGDISQCEFFLNEEVTLSPEENKALFEKLCDKVDTTCKAINYFLIRLVGKDAKAVAYLTSPFAQAKLKPEKLMEEELELDEPGSLLLNTIEIDPGNPDVYTCKSIVETDEGHRIIASTITLDQFRVCDFHVMNNFGITPKEVSQMTKQEEYISHYIIGDSSLSEEFTTKLLAQSMKTRHKIGTLYMIFNPDNSHVDKTQYRLSGDVMGVYYLMDNGHLVVSARSDQEIKQLEKDLATSEIGKCLVPVSKYQFNTPILPQFINNDMEDFEEFVKIISGKK